LGIELDIGTSMRWIVSAVAMVLLVAAGCTTGSEGSSPTIRVLVSGEPEELDAYRSVRDAFERSNPGIGVQLVETPDRDVLIAKLSTAIAGGDPPDLFLLNYRYFGQFAAKGALEALGPRLETSSRLHEDAFYPEALDAFRFGGEPMCLPQNISSLVVYYNKELFDDAGVDQPRPGWSWEEMARAAGDLTTDEDGDGTVGVYGLGVDPEVIRVAPFVWSFGGEVVDNEVRPTRFRFSDPGSTQALQAFLDLRSVLGVVPTEEEAESEDFESRFLNGRLGMLMESRKVVPSFRTITDFEWDVAPLPVWRRPATILHSDGYCLTSEAAHPDAAWRFLQFALGPEGQRVTAETGRTVPSLRQVAESPAFLDPTKDPVSSHVFLDSIPDIRRVPNVSTWPEIEDAANAILEEAFYEGAEAREVAAEIETGTTGLFARAEV
jgi:multiple sugar transport system substrate-binding protein